MATLSLRRFSEPGTLKSIDPGSLLQLLFPYQDYFTRRKLTLGDPDSIDYELLATILVKPDDSIDLHLIDALYYIHEMSTDSGMDSLLEECEKQSISPDWPPKPTPADLAVRVWLRDKDLLLRKHAEQFLISPRSFQYYQSSSGRPQAFEEPTNEVLIALQNDLDNWFEKKLRGRGCKVFVYKKDDGVWFLVRHGAPMRREGCLKEGTGEPSSVCFWPEMHDILVYDPQLNELRIKACSKGEKSLYLESFGLHLFGDASRFPSTEKYTLEPLRDEGAASLVTTDTEELDWVRLKEIQYFWGGPEKEIETRRASDIFASLARRQKTLPDGRIVKATFAVKFASAKSPRTVTIRPSNIASYTRDDDGSVIEGWLSKRGFISTRPADEDEEA